MRHARLKPSAQDTWHHCYNRVVGNRNDRPFDEVDNAAHPRHLIALGLPAANQLNNRAASAAISLSPLSSGKVAKAIMKTGSTATAAGVAEDLLGGK